MMTLHAAALLLSLLAASSLLTSASEDEHLTRLKPNYFPSLASSPDNTFWYYTFDEMDDFFDQSEHWGGMEFNEGLSWEAWLPEKRCLDGTYSHRRVGQTFAERTWINNASLRQEEPCEEGIFPFPWILHDDEGAKWSYALVSEGEDTFNTYMHMISVRYTEEMLHIFNSDPVFRWVGFMVNTTDIWWEPRRHRSRDCNGTQDIVWSRDGVAEISKVWVGAVPISETKVCPEDNHGSWEQRAKEEKVQSTGWFPLFEPSLPDPMAHPEEAGYGFVGFMPIVDFANTTTEEPAPTTERGISTTDRPVPMTTEKQPAPSKTLPHPTVESHHPSLTHVQGSHLRPSHVQGSHLRPSHAQGSHLRPSHAQGSHLRPAHAQGSFFYPARIQGNRDSPWWWSNLSNYGRGSYIEIVECPRVGSACSFRKWGTRISNCCSAAACDTLYCPYYSFTWICADRRTICRKL